MKRLFQLVLLGIIIWVGYQVVYKPPEQKLMDEAVSKQPTTNTFKDGFENARTVTDLFANDWSRWHEITLQNSNFSIRRPVKHCLINMADCITSRTVGNYIEIENGLRRRGENSLKFYAAPFDKTWFGDSRVSIRRQLFDFGEGDELYFSGWFYFQGPNNSDETELQNLNQSMFLSFRARNEGIRTFGEPGPGLSFAFRNTLGMRFDNWLPAMDEVEQDLLNRYHMPLNEWVEVRVKLKLSANKQNGFVEIWLDDRKIISEPAKTLPTADLKYSILELGVNSNLNQVQSQTLYVDNIAVSPNRFEN